MRFFRNQPNNQAKKKKNLKLKRMSTQEFLKLYCVDTQSMRVFCIPNPKSGRNLNNEKHARFADVEILPKNTG